MKNYTVINSKGRAALIAFIEDRAANPIWAKNIAEALIADHDGSYPEASQIVELSALKTKSGNPETYSFEPDEYDVFSLEPEDDF
jgi:hypothetical protein